MNTLRTIAGDYGHALAFQTLEYDARATAITNDLAALQGRRFIVASETKEGRRLNEGRSKWLTGCDPIRARFLYAEHFEFIPVSKFWLAVNHRPVVRDDSHGFWRRVRLIPFTQTFEVNPTLAQTLEAEGPGILRWAIGGFHAWQTRGLDAPPIVLTATDAYRVESDPLGDFLQDVCALDPSSSVVASEIYEHYTAWATHAGLTERERLTATGFGRKLGDRFPKTKIGTKTYYQGSPDDEIDHFATGFHRVFPKQNRVWDHFP